MNQINKLIPILALVFCTFQFENASAQLDNSNSLLQQDLGTGGTAPVEQGGIDDGSSFDPGPVDPNNPDPFEPETDPGGPGGDIDDITPVPIDSGVVFLLSIGLVAGFVQTRKNKMLLLKKAI